jgi:hypothetical protein
MAEHPHTNGYDANALNGFLAQIAEVDDELMSLKGEYMAACKAPRQKIKSILAEVREGGVNLTAFREILTRHRDARRAERRIADLEADDLDAYSMMEQALGEFGNTPLGQAALDRAKQGNETLDTLR